MTMETLEQTTCRICADQAKGVHYGVVTCEGCKGFFKRVTSMCNPPNYRCYFGRNCPLTPETRNNCKACRLQRCIDLGMMQKLSWKRKGVKSGGESEGQTSPDAISDTEITADKAVENHILQAMLQASGLETIDALKSTPSGLALIRKILTGTTKSSPMALKQLISEHLQIDSEGSEKLKEICGTENEIVVEKVDSSKTPEIQDSNQKSESESESQSASPAESRDAMKEELPPMPPLIFGDAELSQLSQLPPPPPLLHFPGEYRPHYTSPSERLPTQMSYMHPVDYSRQCMLHGDQRNHPYKTFPIVPNFMQVKTKRKRGRPRKVRPQDQLPVQTSSGDMIYNQNGYSTMHKFANISSPFLHNV